jgi:hypothetical protein
MLLTLKISVNKIPLNLERLIGFGIDKRIIKLATDHYGFQLFGDKLGYNHEKLFTKLKEYLTKIQV